MGSSRFSEIVLRKLMDTHQNVLSVYTCPDKPAGRGMKQTMSPVKLLAEEHGIRVRTPRSLRDEQEYEALAALRPDFLVVASYGLLLPEKILEIPKIAPLNIHPSLLPLYRGAAPIQRAIQENWEPDSQTGVAIMKLVKELDAGPVYASIRVSIAQHSYGQLTDILADVGGRLLLDTLPAIQAGLAPVPQNHEQATYAAKLTKEDGKIDWNCTAEEIDALIRAVNPWPGARCEFKIEAEILPVIIRSASPGDVATNVEPGRVRITKSGLQVACKNRWLNLETLQAPGKKETSSRAFANGLRLKASGIYYAC